MAEKLRQRGNRQYVLGKYEQAIASYTEAIAKNPKCSVYYTNRALSRAQLNMWEEVAEDCQVSIGLDPKSVKAHFFLGKAQSQMRLYEDAVATLTTAHTLAREQGQNYGDDIASTLRTARRMRWQVEEEQHSRKQGELESYILELMEEDKSRQLSLLKNDDSNEREKIQQKHRERSLELQKLFRESDKRREQREIPEYLIGKIGYELMKDPVIVPSGITYDRQVLEEHLERVGHFDPLTREPLVKKELIPNLALKEVLDAFVAENGWMED